MKQQPDKSDIERAIQWHRDHRVHVIKLIENYGNHPGFPPSGSDSSRPELWKGGHWTCFFGNAQKIMEAAE